MNLRTRIGAFVALMLLVMNGGVMAQTGSLTVHVDRPGAKISPLFYGLMTEEINHSYDGGLYAELLQNRAFKDDPNQPHHWSLTAKDKGSLALDRAQPLNSASPLSLRLTASDIDAGQSVGVENEGYWGIPLRPNTTYRASIFARSATAGLRGVTLSLESADHRQLYARAELPALGTRWKQYRVTLKTGDLTPSTENRFVVRMQQAGTLWLSQASLFPPTYRNRPNGSRADLMELMRAMKPAYLRFPGGNYLEGNTIAERFDWKKTLGAVHTRPGHPCPWGYPSTDGFGLQEFLDWCEDLKMEPLLAVFAGYALNGEVIKAGEQLKPFVQDALDEIEYLIGDTHTKWGAERAKNGHPAPYALHYVEIGNEDWFDRSGSYDGRFAQFYDAIKAKYPDLKLIATMFVKSRTPDLLDDHYYRSARDMMNDAQHYARYNRNGTKIFVGEWASTEGNPTPTMNAALGDAAWLTGLEANADVVVMQCYAPLLVNVNKGAQQWGTNLIGYDALRSFGSPSYYVQQMFGNNRGDVVLPVTLNQPPAPPSAPFVPQGAVGVGSWATQVEYKEMRVTQGDTTLFTDNGSADWHKGQGDWKREDGVLRQTSLGIDCRNIVGNPKWTDYTFTLKARKTGGNEGFLILFHVEDQENYIWWNIGGWGNSRTVLERATNGAKREIGNVSSAIVESGRWYDIKVEVHGNQIRCYMDGQLIVSAEDKPAPPPKPLYATASRDLSTGEVILKVVNGGETPHSLKMELQGVKMGRQKAKLWTLSGQPKDVNTLDQPRKVAPIFSNLSVTGSLFEHTFPAYSVSVLRFKAQ